MSEPAKFVLMRVNAAGYVGEPVSMLCSFDPATDILLALKAMPYETTERPGFLHITTQLRDPVRDTLFTEDQTSEAIAAFFSLDAMRLINLGEPVKMFNPANAIERIGMDDTGMKYQIRPEITNGQYAILIAAFMAEKQREVNTISAFSEELQQVFTTIG